MVCSSISCLELLSSLSRSSVKFFTLASSSSALFFSAPRLACTALISSPTGAISSERLASFALILSPCFLFLSIVARSVSSASSIS